MKFTSPVYSAVSGSIDGLTYSRNRFGMYVRGRATPVQPNTDRQQTMRAAMRVLANLWSETLTEVQRNEWRLYASNVAMTDKLGQQIFLTGQQHFIRSNLPAIQNEVDIVSDGPGIFDLGQFTLPTFTAGASTGISLAFDNTDDWVNEDDAYMFVRVGRPVAASRAFFKGPFRLSGKIVGSKTSVPTSPAAITSEYTLTAGSNIWISINVLRADGRLSNSQIAGPVKLTS